MTHRVGNCVVICREDDDECELCGAAAETRPYGPNRERICFSCGMKDEDSAMKVFKEDILGIKEQ